LSRVGCVAFVIDAAVCLIAVACVALVDFGIFETPCTFLL
jgi:hypothetical protein